MNLQMFGRELVQVLATRALEALREASMDDVERILAGRLPTPRSTPSAITHVSSPHLGTTVGAFAIGAAVGAGLTALYAPTSGGELRKKLSFGTADARKQAVEMGETVREQLGEARTSVARRLKEVSTAVGLATPAPRRADGKAKSNGHASRPSRAKKSPAPRTQDGV